MGKLTRWTKDNSPTILAGLGIVGGIATVIFAIKATPKAERIVEELHEKYEIEDESEDEVVEVPKTEIAKAVLPVYLPTIGMGIVAIACVIGSTVVSNRRYAVLEALYSAAEVALTDYQRKVIERFGEKEEKKVVGDLAQEKIEAQPVTKSQVVFTGHGDTLFYDAWSGRYFRSDYQDVRAAVNDFNTRLINEMYVGLNEFYGDIGLPAIDAGKYIGFDIDNQVDFIYTTMHADDMTPCTVLTFRNRPRREKF